MAQYHMADLPSDKCFCLPKCQSINALYIVPSVQIVDNIFLSLLADCILELYERLAHCYYQYRWRLILAGQSSLPRAYGSEIWYRELNGPVHR